MVEAEAVVLVLLHWRSSMREKNKGSRLRGNLWEGMEKGMKKKLEKWVAERYIGNCSVSS